MACFEVENDNGNPTFLLHFLLEAVKMYNILKYK